MFVFYLVNWAAVHDLLHARWLFRLIIQREPEHDRLVEFFCKTTGTSSELNSDVSCEWFSEFEAPIRALVNLWVMTQKVSLTRGMKSVQEFKNV